MADKAARCCIIAEAGVNHNGSIDMALSLIDAAAAAGADIVKFQTFKAEAVVSRFAPKAEYQIDATGSDESQLEMVRRLELSRDDHRSLLRHCASRGIGFLSTPFDIASARFLVQELGLGQLKIPSGELTNAPLLLEMARMGRPVILSTGMSSLGEIEEALGVLALGYLNSTTRPSREAFRQAYLSDEGQALLCEKASLLHCTTEYPAPYEETNLTAMDTLKHAFGLPVGFSDHTEGIAIPLAAVARGAVIIEKHFTLD
ncbi:partial N-acetylneuraminate synthase, partial [Anaerolineae bacterium]